MIIRYSPVLVKPTAVGFLKFKIDRKPTCVKDTPAMSQHVGARIRQRRLEAGKSAIAIAELAGISKGYLSSIENDKVGKPSPQVLLAIADALDTTVGDLLSTEEVRPRIKPIPNALRELQVEAGLTEDEVQDLALIEFRGRRPVTKDDWRYLLDTVTRAFGTSGGSPNDMDEP